MILYADIFCLLSRAAAKIRGLFMGSPFGRLPACMQTQGRENRDDAARLLGALPIPLSKMETECLYVGGQVIGLLRRTDV